MLFLARRGEERGAFALPGPVPACTPRAWRCRHVSVSPLVENCAILNLLLIRLFPCHFYFYFFSISCCQFLLTLCSLVIDVGGLDFVYFSASVLRDTCSSRCQERHPSVYLLRISSPPPLLLTLQSLKRFSYPAYISPSPNSIALLYTVSLIFSVRAHPVLSSDVSVLSCGSGGDSSPLGPMDLDKPMQT